MRKTTLSPYVTFALVLVVVAGGSAGVAWSAPREGSGAVAPGPTHVGRTAQKPKKTPRPAASRDLTTQADSLLDDLVKQADSLLDEDTNAVDAGPDASTDASPNTTPDAEVPAPLSSAAPGAAAPPPVEPPPPPPPRDARAARIASGKNLPMGGAADSPLAKLGIPLQAVPAVAGVVTAGAMAIWPFLTKTLTSLLKTLIATLMKNRAKKKVKVEAAPRTIYLFGSRMSAAELGAMIAGVVCYAAAVAYAFLGRKLTTSFFLGQVGLIAYITIVRTLARVFLSRRYSLGAQYKLWFGGAFLCLGSAFLGNTLNTVGFEVEASSSGPDTAARNAKLKASLVAVGLVMAALFCWANLVSPAKVLQSGRVATSGGALAEILPITPMAGLKIYKWNRPLWAALCVTVVVSFVYMNYVW